MAKVKRLETDHDQQLEAYLFECPGCGWHHVYIVKCGTVAYREAPTWSFNGNVGRSTFQPSLLNCGGSEGPNHRCHLYVTDGRIAFCADSTHEFAGHTMEMLDC